jgi:hypothetical protein
LLVRLHLLPRWVVPLLMAGLCGVGLIARGPLAIAALVVLIGFVSWLCYLSWPAVNARGRLPRLFLLGLLAAMLVLQVSRL